MSISIVCIVFLGLFSACDIDPHQGKRPIDYENSIWISDNPIVYIKYEESGVLESAYLIEEDEYIYIDVLYGSFDNSVLILDLDGNILLECNAEFSSDLFILNIKEHTTDIFLDYTIITLYRSQ